MHNLISKTFPNKNPPTPVFIIVIIVIIVITIIINTIVIIIIITIIIISLTSARGISWWTMTSSREDGDGLC